MDKGNDFCIGVLFNRSLELLRVDRIAPTIHHHDGGRTTTLDILFHTTAKHAVLAHDHFI